MESQLSFAQKISKKSLKLAKIAFLEVSTKSGKKSAMFGTFSNFSIFYLQNDQISFLAICASFKDFLLRGRKKMTSEKNSKFAKLAKNENWRF